VSKPRVVSMPFSQLHTLLVDRLDAATTAEDSWPPLVLAAFEGPDALADLLDQGAAAEPHTPETRPTPGPAPAAYLRSIAVEGFRGVGPRSTLELKPGPGLTLVVGRNGSGKSSFAEGLELLLTGDSKRWEGRATVWREGWRNLHHEPARLEAELSLEGEPGPCKVWRHWSEGQDLGDATAEAQIQGKAKGILDALGWEEPLQSHRPFLSYNELGSMLDEGPSKLHDALHRILGLDTLAEAQTVLKDARSVREKALKEAEAQKEVLEQEAQGLDDERARRVVEALQTKDWDLEAIHATLSGEGDAREPTSLLDTLRRIASLEVPDASQLLAVAEELRAAARGAKAAADTLTEHSRDLADVLDHALRFHEKHGDGACPLCGREGALDEHWHHDQAARVKQLRDEASELEAAQQKTQAARQAWAALPFHWDPAFTAAGLDTAPVQAALQEWAKGNDIEETEALADHTEASGDRLINALAELSQAARAELDRRQDLWRPLAEKLSAWLPAARQTRGERAHVVSLKAAEKWLKGAAASLRDERFQPIADRASEIWKLLRQQSHVDLGAIRLEGTGTRRRVTLDVTIDGVKGAALGVMSQGELHSLALSLFVPRATLPESPFRFIVIDDPVQSMDPARVDGLAKVLEIAAHERQVLVFTHDDRLPEAIRRLGIEASITEVTRRESSVIELRQGLDPVARHINDALVLTQTKELPIQASRRVIPGFCRQAIEAACIEAFRRRRLGRGEAHADVEKLLEGAHKTMSIASLALFDEPGQEAKVLPRLHKQKREFADVFRQCNEGAHQLQAGVMLDLVRGTERLARWLQQQK
jgi:recombinational DNA repair ATPase RecF